MIATADPAEGAYGPRRLCLTGGGHNTFFRDRDGQWWCTMFGNPRGSLPDRPFVCRPAIVPIAWEDDLPVPIWAGS